MNATFARHESFEDGHAATVVVRHSDRSCPFARELGEPAPAREDAVDCRFCFGGDAYGSLGRKALLPEDGPSYTEIAEGNYKPPPGPHDGPAKPYEVRLAEVSEWLLTLDRKVEVRDIDYVRFRVARAWARRYDGNFEFMLDMKRKGVKSDTMAKAVLNCLRAQLHRQSRPPREHR